MTTKQSTEQTINIDNTHIPAHFVPLERDFLLSLYHDYNTKAVIPRIYYKLQHGGSKVEHMKWIDDGGAYTFKVSVNDRDLAKEQQAHLSIVPGDDQNQACLTVTFDTNKKVAIINNMSYDDSCALEGFRKNGGGTILLRFSLNLILKYKEKYGFDKIMLRDNSFIYCRGCSNSLKLARLRIITHGYPWYMKFGFKPCTISQATKSGPTEVTSVSSLMDNLKTTNLILSSLRMSNTILKIVANAIKEEKLDISMDTVERMAQQYPLVSHLIQKMLKEFDKYCCIVSHILLYIFSAESKIGLTDFSGKTFYLSV